MVARRAFTCWLQEEERERRMDFIPDESAINTEAIEVRLGWTEGQGGTPEDVGQGRESAHACGSAVQVVAADVWGATLGRPWCACCACAQVLQVC